MAGGNGKPSILITEDDEAVREALTEVLTSEGYSVVLVSNIAAAREQIRHHPFTVLLLAAQEGEDGKGLDWLIDFVAHEGAPRIIIVSGSRSAPALGARFGVTVVEKPFDIDALVAEIVSVTGTDVRARDRDSGG
jgi:DNA-binding response OmpR family regulator